MLLAGWSGRVLLKSIAAHFLSHSNPSVCLLVTILLPYRQMATTHPLPALKAVPVPVPDSVAQNPKANDQALVPSLPQGPQCEPIALSAPMARLPVELEVSVPVREFRVRTLLALELGQVLGTEWEPGEDMPLLSGDVQLAWSEFEVVDSKLAVRVTRLV
jgi:flagellar motor switch protein FliN/FliY